MDFKLFEDSPTHTFGSISADSPHNQKNDEPTGSELQIPIDDIFRSSKNEQQDKDSSKPTTLGSSRNLVSNAAMDFQHLLEDDFFSRSLSASTNASMSPRLSSETNPMASNNTSAMRSVQYQQRMKQNTPISNNNSYSGNDLNFDSFLKNKKINPYNAADFTQNNSPQQLEHTPQHATSNLPSTNTNFNIDNDFLETLAIFDNQNNVDSKKMNETAVSPLKTLPQTHPEQIDTFWYKDRFENLAQPATNVNSNGQTMFSPQYLNSVAKNDIDTASQISSSIYSSNSFATPSIISAGAGPLKNSSFGTGFGRPRRMSIGEESGYSGTSSRLLDSKSISGKSVKSRASRDDDRLHRKRSCHNEVERRRRDLIKYKINELNDLVPPTLFNRYMKNATTKPKKRIVLCGSIDYLKVLMNIIAMQKANKKLLLTKIKEYEHLLDYAPDLKSNAPVVSGFENRLPDNNTTHSVTKTTSSIVKARTPTTSTPEYQQLNTYAPESLDFIKSEKDLNKLLMLSEKQEQRQQQQQQQKQERSIGSNPHVEAPKEISPPQSTQQQNAEQHALTENDLDQLLINDEQLNEFLRMTSA